jgi:hypothetical protein
MNKQNNFDNLLLTIYSYTISAFLGWQIFSFINIYFQLNQNRIQFSFQQWMAIQSIYIPLASVIIIVLSILIFTRDSIKHKQFPLNYASFRLHKIWLFLLIAGALINYILYIYQLHQNILELINLVFAILCIGQFSKLFYIKEKSAWYHPTTLSAFYISTALLGISQLLVFETLNNPFSGYAYLLLVLLLIEVLRIFTRFKYLTKFSYETNMIARSLLGKYGIYFGVRVVAGIFMPFVYIIYALYANEKLFQGVGALLIIGEFIERLLFIYLSNSAAPKTTD